MFKRKEDSLIWNYAKNNNFTILTFDEDFEELSYNLGFPPKVIIMKTSNLSTQEIEQILRKNLEHITMFIEQSKIVGCVVLQKN